MHVVKTTWSNLIRLQIYFIRDPSKKTHAKWVSHQDIAKRTKITAGNQHFCELMAYLLKIRAMTKSGLTVILQSHSFPGGYGCGQFGERITPEGPLTLPPQVAGTITSNKRNRKMQEIVQVLNLLLFGNMSTGCSPNYLTSIKGRK